MLASFSPTDAKDPETWIPVQHGAILWAAASGLERRRLHDGASTVAFSPRTSEIAITAGRRVTLRDAATGAQLREFTSPSKGVNTVAMSPDGQHLLTGDGDGLARMWRVATGELACEFKGHTDGLRSVALSPDGARLATAGDHTARLYGMRPPGRRRAARAGHTSDVFTVRFATQRPPNFSRPHRIGPFVSDGRSQRWTRPLSLCAPVKGAIASSRSVSAGR